MVETVTQEKQANIIYKIHSLKFCQESESSENFGTNYHKNDKKESGNSVSTKSSELQKYEEKLLQRKQVFMEAVENHINSKTDIEPFFVADMSKVRDQHEKWVTNLPRFTPFYAVKSNNDPVMLKTLISLGTSFDCASSEEIKTMLDLGVPPSKIIFANPCKSPAHIKYAAEKGVTRMTFDNDYELFKIKENYPNAKLVIRILVDDSNSICQFGVKFGAHPNQTKDLLETAQKLDLDVIGVSFHVGSGCMSPSSFGDAIKRARNVFDEAKDLGYNFTLLDIGGGFPGLGAQNGFPIKFEQIAEVVNKAVDTYFPEDNVEFIAEPGRYYCSPAFTLVANITSKRTHKTTEKSTHMYYINDGVYGSFNSLIFDHAVISYPEFVIKNHITGCYNYYTSSDLTSNTFESSMWGPTCDSMDCLSKSIKLPELSLGDYLVFDNMGAYTLVASSRFNGMSNPKVYYINSDSASAIINPDYDPFFFINQRSILSEGYS